MFCEDLKWKKIGEAHLSYYASANDHKTYLSVQCDILRSAVFQFL